MSYGLLIQGIVFLALVGGILFTLWFSYLKDNLLFSLIPLLLECALFIQVMILYFYFYENALYLPSDRQVIMAFLQIMGLLIAVFLPVYYDQKQKKKRAVNRTYLLENLLNQTTEAIAVKNINGEYVITNSVFEELFFIKSENVKGAKGTTDMKLFGREIAKEIEKKEDKVFENSKPQNLEIQLPVNDGGKKWFHIILTPFRNIDINNDEANKYGVTMIFRDVTNLVQSRERAKNANRMKTKFLAQLSHELRTPLNSIIGMNELLESTSLDEKQEFYVENCSSACRNLLNLTNDILDLSKIESGNLKLEEESFDLHNFIYSMGNLYARDSHQKGLELILDLDNDVPQFVIGDKSRLDQVLGNLLSNAIKFTENGKVSLRLETGKVTNGKANIIFEVSDTGPGIPEKHKEQIFDEFHQVNLGDQNGKQNQVGSGLGLSICQQLVKLMNGSIELVSQCDVGTVFRVEIPFELPGENDYSDSDINNDEDILKDYIISDGLQCLVIDKSIYNREFLEKILDDWGSNFETISDIKNYEDCHVLNGEHDKFDLVFMDHETYTKCLSNLTSTAEWILSKHHVIHITDTVSYHSNYTHIDDQYVDMTLIKPLTRQYLAKAILRVLYGESIRQSSIDCMGIEPYDSKIKKEEEEIDELKRGMSHKSCKILIAEDNESNQILLDEMLDNMPFELEFANNGQEAFNSYKENQYDMILMDLGLPKMNGYEVTQKIRDWEEAKEFNQRIPIIAFTAHVMNDEKNKAVEEDFNDFLKKPFTRKKLIKMLYNYLPIDTKFSQVSKSKSKSKMLTDQKLSKDVKVKEEKGNQKIHTIDNDFKDVPKKLRPIILKYLRNVQTKLSKLNDNIKNKNKEIVINIGHNLKGSGSTYGLKEISFYGEKIEEAAESGLWKKLRELIRELDSYTNKVINHFKKQR